MMHNVDDNIPMEQGETSKRLDLSDDEDSDTESNLKLASMMNFPPIFDV